MTGLTSAGRGQDLRAAQTAIRRVTGVDPRPWFRCPFGDGMDDPGVLADVERLGYRSVGWDVDSFDWQASATGPLVARRIVDGAVAHGDGAVILEHPWTRGTGRGLQPAIDGLRAHVTLVASRSASPRVARRSRTVARVAGRVRGDPARPVRLDELPAVERVTGPIVLAVDGGNSKTTWHWSAATAPCWRPYVGRRAAPGRRACRRHDRPAWARDPGARGGGGR